MDTSSIEPTLHLAYCLPRMEPRLPLLRDMHYYEEGKFVDEQFFSSKKFFEKTKILCKKTYTPLELIKTGSSFCATS